MQFNPAEEWLRLARLYSEMSEAELEALAGDMASLTEIARPILRDELKKRGFKAPATEAPGSDGSPWNGGWRDDSRAAKGQSEAGNEPDKSAWKTVLRECDDWDQAWKISDALGRAGIKNWTEGPSTAYESAVFRPRVMVTADRLDEALAIASKVDTQAASGPRSEFVPSRCPKCGAADPVLESTEPSNRWRCEDCGAEWNDEMTVDGG